MHPPLDRHEKWLREWIENGKYKDRQLHNVQDWKNQVVGQCMSWIKSDFNLVLLLEIIGGLKFLKNAEGKVLMFGLMLQLGIFQQPKNGLKKGKIGKTIGKTAIPI